MNSATAHLVNEGDEVLVASYRFFDIEAEEKTKSASVVLCGKGNEIEIVRDPEAWFCPCPKFPCGSSSESLE